MKTQAPGSTVQVRTVAWATAVLLLATLIAGDRAALPARAQVPYLAADFDDLEPGVTYPVGQAFASGGLPFCVQPFIFGDGQVYAGGEARVSTDDATGTGTQELFLSSVTVRFGFRGLVESLEFDYRLLSGTVGLVINGELIEGLETLTEIDGREIGGVLLEVFEDGNRAGHLIARGPIEAFTIGGEEFALDNVQLSGDFSPTDPCFPSAIRILLLTQEDHVAEYNLSIQPGRARGHANQFNQWLVVVLDPEHQPLDAYGIWDPRLALVHGLDGQHSAITIDSQTAYVFDVVLPFTASDDGRLPVEMLLYDQDLQLLADVPLAPVILRHCEQQGPADPACRIVLQRGLDVAPLSDLSTQDFYDRPQASLNEEILADSPQILPCLPPGPLPPEELAALLYDCQVDLQSIP